MNQTGVYNMEYDKKKHYDVEKSFHDDLAKTVKPLRDIEIWEIENWNYILNVIGNLKDKKILDVGCGFGRESIILSKKGALVTAIDISDKSIEVAKISASSQGINNIDFKVLKVENLDCEKKFDIIFCRGSLHHFYDVKGVIKHLYRCLKNEGIIIAQEPKAENPIAVIGRKFFNPSTPTEHPFKTGELKEIFSDIFGNAHVKYFNLVSPLCFTFEKIKFLKSDPLKNALFKLLDPIDKFLLSYGPMEKYSWLEIVWSTKIE